MKGIQESVGKEKEEPTHVKVVQEGVDNEREELRRSSSSLKAIATCSTESIF